MTITVAQLREYLNDRRIVARQDTSESSNIAPNSYGAGYDRGELDTIEDILDILNGEREI